jgi:23S rRNA pseudouridine1911/1915/1917 synthase
MKILIEEANKERLDLFLTKKLEISRSNINKHIKLGDILVNETIVKSGYILNLGDVITVNDLTERTDVIGEQIDLDIYYEDDDVLVVNKPSGMVVHPANGNYHGTLVNALVGRVKLSDINGENRPGIVHRIDKDTSGLLLVAKNNKAHRILSEDFKNKRITRRYIALVNGIIENEKIKIDAPIGRCKTDRKKMMVTKDGKQAVTNFKVLERYKTSTLIECELETGRTHQIRVHLAYIDHPVINDPTYGKGFSKYGQMLHAGVLGFEHPITKKYLEFTAPLEPEFLDILETYKNL